ncbi:ectoine/hydroxyectoine ABC transporter permease subunit EhuC [Mycolicibacterium smegmatis]|uniref:ectoine/hydroxyectoine ABC transporter permease subunit EhuC n=1 Tax=Mycolicibacterium smegmatis TaxID=1772 RepID=UPI001E3F9017|nr:ectoine/hydroxyectoine ABC transporter permease subunit EhuC [Mycolicibacterium smegmatis]UGU32660.1 ectoine/hydroxyectoine ABC transporter permease subunit EhuC [Mycolicibacterium smegmatis]ULN67549.1 ectoine/hydroxyectoine ABC transporter permease subunit EhuC [Mycolicibacterium smegmatis]
MNQLLQYQSLLWEGLWTTVLVTVFGILIAVVVAFVVGFMRLSRHRIVRASAYVFVEFFRGTSILVQLAWVVYALPFLGVRFTDNLVAGIVVLGLNEGAYAAEIVRGAIASRPRGQTEAAVALGMKPAQRMRRILVPQSIPVMLPSFGNVAVDLLKATPLVYFIGVADFTANGLAIRTETQDTTTILLTLLVVYFILALILAAITRWLENRFGLEHRRRGLLRGSPRPVFRPMIGSTS